MLTMYILLYVLLALSVGAIGYGFFARSKTIAVIGAAFLIILLLLLLSLYLSTDAILLGGYGGMQV